ncbi:phage head closure protein [Xylocopilactobacillus apis]|uniref:Head-tail adaptor protein n=1 Tax=Xylocopilactobacillus apis TaxID=2932183 RepID=A0AAU9DF77_9LACO|nr:phage head closure protein [Xylocopilactobacillus apis]BDR56881.1 hypothetical protein KIMC2_14430 [Xylocopilactobacillus apis]
MVQMSNPMRLDLKLKLGHMGGVGEDVNGLVTEGFVADKTVASDHWVRTQNQQISIQGTSLQGTRIFVVHHREDWDDLNFTHVQLKDKVFKIVTISPDVDDSPTSYDLVTVSEVEKNG